jgi:hypothetical protein
MNAIEFVKTPFYIAQFNNVVTPLTTINLKYNMLVFIETLSFITRQTITMLWKKINLSPELIVLGVLSSIYLASLFGLTDIMEKNLATIRYQSEEIENLKKEIICLKKLDKTHEINEHNLLEEVKKYYNENNETNKKLIAMERKVNRLVKEAKMYE